MVFAEREPLRFHRVLVLSPGLPELLCRCRLAHVSRSLACLDPLSVSEVQSVHCSVPNLNVAGEPAIRVETGKGKSEELAKLAADAIETLETIQFDIKECLSQLKRIFQ